MSCIPKKDSPACSIFFCSVSLSRVKPFVKRTKSHSDKATSLNIHMGLMSMRSSHQQAFGSAILLNRNCQPRRLERSLAYPRSEHCTFGFAVLASDNAERSNNAAHCLLRPCTQQHTWCHTWTDRTVNKKNKLRAMKMHWKTQRHMPSLALQYIYCIYLCHVWMLAEHSTSVCAVACMFI
jgi:hypothetical protein